MNESSITRLTPLVFVLPWYGPDVPGGAETDTRYMAEYLSAAGLPVEVWTTCARQLGSDWNENHYRPGASLINGVLVTRFLVTHINRERFWPIYLQLSYGRRVTPEEEALFFAQSIRSRALCDQIRARLQACPDTVFIFKPYLFGTTYWGAFIAPERSFLFPCLHDEAFARLVALRPLFRAVRGILCYTRAEKRLVQQLYGVPDERLAVVGAGITLREQGDAQRFRQRYNIFGPFMLYAGRKSPSKNTPLLLIYFKRYLRRRGAPLELVLVGGGQVSIPPGCRRAVHDLGFVPDQDKLGAFAAAMIFCQPSIHESFSIVLMEAWGQGKAALVNARCAVTREHCQQSQGGLYFNGYQEFEAALDLLLSDKGLHRWLGEHGRRYVERNYTWEQVADRFLEAISKPSRVFV